jgi:hypothetical protein
VPRPCTVCTGKKRDEVNAGIRAGTPLGRIAADTGVPETTLRRHSETCVPKTVALAAAAVGIGDLVSGAGIAAEAVGLYGQVTEILAEARGAKDLQTALNGIGRALDCLTLVGKLTGRLRPETQVNVLHASPDWLAMRERIADALEPYPDALDAVRRAFAGE